MRVLRGARGFTLIEVMVAITVLMLVILPLASLYVRSLTVIQNAGLYSQAIQLAQERMDLCQVLEYDGLYYYNEVYTPGFPFSESNLPATHRWDGLGGGMNPVYPLAYDTRDIPETDNVELNFDPTDSEDRHYPVPVYRDYYNNYTGQCIDPNFNGLCDDDLDGDGEPGILAFGGTGTDMDDIEIATNGRLTMYSDPEFQGTPAENLGNTYAPGDGLYDTVVEGAYVSSMDQMYRKVRITESISPILDVGLLLDKRHTEPPNQAVPDFRHREAAYRNFVRMTTIIDPTPSLANPNDMGVTWVDALYIRDRVEDDGYTAAEIRKLLLCLERDLPLQAGMTNYDVGVDEQGFVDPDPFSVNYSPPIYGLKVIVTVFYLTGEGEVEFRDVDGDGELDEVPVENYGGARRMRLERMFYNTDLISGTGKRVPPIRAWYQSTEGTNDNPVRSLALPYTDDADLCDLDHNGLPYLYPDY